MFIRISAINVKQDLFVDEVFTTQIANYSPYYSETPVTIEPNLSLNGYELKQKLLSIDPSAKDTISDIINLHTFTKDTSHSNLYYSLYRLWFNGWHEFNLQKFIRHGCHLNLIFFTIGFIYLYKILNLLFKKNKALIPFGLFTAFASTAAITNTTFIRTYALQEMFFLILTYIFIKHWKRIENKSQEYKIYDIFIPAVTIALTFLTGYYAAFLILIYSILLITKATRLKNFDALKFFVITAITTILLTFLIYPGITFVLSSYRATETYEKFLQYRNLKIFLIYTPLIFFRYIFCIPIILTLIIYLKRIKSQQLHNKDSVLTLILICTSLIWTLFILYISPYKNVRYIMSITPLLMLIFPYIASKLEHKKTFIIFTTAIFLLNIFISFSEFMGINIRKYIPFPAKIEFLKNANRNKFIFLQDKNLPVLIIQDGILSPVPVYTQLADEQMYYTYNKTPKNIKFSHLYTIRCVNNPEKLPPQYKLINIKEDKPADYVYEEYILE